MADFRRCLYALALVALLAGFTASASAQAFQCTNSTGVPPGGSGGRLFRADGRSRPRLHGWNSHASQPDRPGRKHRGQPGYVRERARPPRCINQVEFLESLLMIDEPNSPSNPDYADPELRPHGALRTPLQAGAGVCSILGGGSLGAAVTYNGTTGHPNVFQGRSFRLITGQNNQVVFSGVPIDPPGNAVPQPGQRPVPPHHPHHQHPRRCLHQGRGSPI